MPSRDEILKFYEEQQDPNEWELEHFVNVRPEELEAQSTFAERLTRLNGRPGRLLDVGCAAGHLLSGARAQGWDVLGVEASPKFSSAAKARGLPVHAGTLSDLPSTDPFDVIVMLDVLEHLPDPVEELRRCRCLLRPGGYVVVATCNIGSFAARWYGLKWRQIVISHTFYWTERSLRVALERAGLAVSDVASVRWWDPDKHAQRSLRRREFAKLLARKVLRATWMPVAERSAIARSVVEMLGVDHGTVRHKVGGQVVMSEVALVVGTR